MLPSLDGIQLKLQRAYQQIEGLKRELTAFINTRPYEPTFQLDRVPGITNPAHIWRFTIRVAVKKPCPPEWGVVIGEIIHDIRSALDHLIYQLVIHAKGTPPPDGSRTQFPIFLDRRKFQSSSRAMLSGVSKKATVLIELLQPFSTGEGTASPLWHLNQLSNIDKHRTVHLAGGTVHAFNFSFPPLANPAKIVREEVREAGAFEHNAVFLRGRLLGDDPPFLSEKVKMNAQMTYEVVFDQRTTLVGGWSVAATLLRIADGSRDCIIKIGRDILSVDFALDD